MNMLAVISFPRENSAGEVAVVIERMRAENLVRVDDIAWMTRRVNGRLKLHHGIDLNGADPGTPSRRLMLGLILLLPLFGMKVGTPVSSLKGLLDTYGVDEEWIRNLVRASSPPGSALFFTASGTGSERLLSSIKTGEDAVITTHFTANLVQPTVNLVSDVAV
jgi:uncharacterized membrane protein